MCQLSVQQQEHHLQESRLMIISDKVANTRGGFMGLRLFLRITLLGLSAYCANASAEERVRVFDGEPVFGFIQSISVSAVPEQHQGPCPAQITFTARVISTKDAEVLYQWQRSDGAHSKPEQMQLHRGGNTLTTTWTLGGAALPEYEGWQLFVIKPNIESEERVTGSDPAEFRIVCDRT